MAKDYWVADTETTTGEYNENYSKVWAWAITKVGNEQEIHYGTDIDTMMYFFSKHQDNYFFHNLKFDGSFIIGWLLRHDYTFNSGTRAWPHTFQCLISKAGQWYQIKICYGRVGRHLKSVTIQDSYKKLPFKVADLADAFNTKEKKTSINYDLNPDNVDWLQDANIKTYISNDVRIVSEALDVQFDEGMKKMTIGADSLASYRDSIGKKAFEHLFPQLDSMIDHDIRKAYRGGFVWANPVFAGKDIGVGRVYDVNSLYPSRMRYSLLPYGMPEIFTGKYEPNKRRPLYVQSIRCAFEIKPDHIPTIQLKNTGMFANNKYLTSSGGEAVTLTLSNPDIELLFKHYNVTQIEYLGGYSFAAKHGLFDDWIDQLMEIKMHATGAIRQLAKLRLNNLYGKFAKSTDNTRREPYLKDDGSLGLRIMSPETGSGLYIPMGVFITAWARYYTITTAQRCYDRILYCDTDSIHIVGNTIPHVISQDVDPVKLGYWKHESTFRRGRFLRPKTYIEDIDARQNKLSVGLTCSYPFGSEQNKTVTKVIKLARGKSKNIKGKSKIFGYILDKSIYARDNTVYSLHIRCAGMQDKTRKKVTWNNFNFGFVDETGKLRPKQVKGGVILVDGPFSIKA
jgi:hypothetical protein